jgi:tetratricopeptide (TPR) repeat protein
LNDYRTKEYGYFMKAVDLAPNNWDFIFNLIVTYLDRNDIEPVPFLLERLERINPREAVLPYFKYGNVLFKLDLLDQAEDVYTKVLSIDSNYIAASYNLAILYLRNGNFIDGKKYLKHTEQIDPNYRDLQKLLNQFFASK